MTGLVWLDVAGLAALAVALTAAARDGRRARQDTAQVGRCGAEAPSLVGSGYLQWCALPAGHAGWHRGADGAEWGLRHPAPPVTDTEAGRDA